MSEQGSEGLHPAQGRLRCPGTAGPLAKQAASQQIRTLVGKEESERGSGRLQLLLGADKHLSLRRARPRMPPSHPAVAPPAPGPAAPQVQARGCPAHPGLDFGRQPKHTREQHLLGKAQSAGEAADARAPAAASGASGVLP